jgi:hypothetical protein
VTAALAADPEKAQKFGDAVEAARPSREDRLGHRHRRAEATYEFLDEVAFKQVRELIGLDQVDAPSPAPRPSPPSCSPGSGPSASPVGGLRHVGDVGPHDLHRHRSSPAPSARHPRLSR